MLKWLKLGVETAMIIKNNKNFSRPAHEICNSRNIVYNSCKKLDGIRIVICYMNIKILQFGMLDGREMKEERSK